LPGNALAGRHPERDPSTGTAWTVTAITRTARPSLSEVPTKELDACTEQFQLLVYIPPARGTGSAEKAPWSRPSRV